MCVTGGIADPMYENRKEFGKWVEELGGVFNNKLTKDTDVLVVSAGGHGLGCVWVGGGNGAGARLARNTGHGRVSAHACILC